MDNHLNLLKRIWNWVLNHFFLTFTTLFIINIILTLLRKIIPLGVIILSFFLIIVYVIMFLANRIRINITKLLHHELKFSEIITGYITSVIFIVLLFSILYWGSSMLGIGYLKYGQCVDKDHLTREFINNDPLYVKDLMHYPYFSAITFFTVGFGDICPMGAAKVLTMLNALIGNAFTVLILAIAITNYSQNKDNDGVKK
jgi:potassium channel LctB